MLHIADSQKDYLPKHLQPSHLKHIYIDRASASAVSCFPVCVCGGAAQCHLKRVPPPPLHQCTKGLGAGGSTQHLDVLLPHRSCTYGTFEASQDRLRRPLATALPPPAPTLIPQVQAEWLCREKEEGRSTCESLTRLADKSSVDLLVIGSWGRKGEKL